MTIKEGFYRVELINTVWEVPERYQNLMPVGTGAFGQVRDTILSFMTYLLTLFCRCVQQQTQKDNLQMVPQLEWQLKSWQDHSSLKFMPREPTEN